ncbi:EF-hand domain type 2 [Trinorchestia longiramus]|nr:EF-hand domain type 2 [Trinorchestia longiramus]
MRPGTRRSSLPGETVTRPSEAFRNRSGGFNGEGATQGKRRRSSTGFMNAESMEVVQQHSRPEHQQQQQRSASLGHVTADLRHPGLDAIRFASYRTAAKLRYVQKRTNMHLVDIWNIIEAFRENALNTLDPYTDVKVSRLETLISTLYHSLNKRLAVESRISVAASTAILLNWLLAAYDRKSAGQVQVFSVKVALVTLCNSKPLDKLRYIFSQISDSNGHLGLERFSEYLQEVLTLPAAVYESPSFPYSDHLAQTIFDGVWRINVNDFLDVLLSDPGPDCLTWLPLLHRLAQSESVIHSTGCDGCRREQFSGLRYKCDTCSNYNLCQDCFWLGRVSVPHLLQHPVKEYMTPHPSRPLSMSMRRSLRCIPAASSADPPRFPETPEPTLDLSHIVPAVSHGVSSSIDDPSNPGPNSCDTWSSNRSLPGSGPYPDWGSLDDEHRLIAHYAHCLALQHGTNTTSGTPGDGADAAISPSCLDSFKVQKELILELETKNREITKEINKIKEQTQAGSNNPALASELRTLRSHKCQLEGQLGGLQDSRKQLMQQLEVLMNRLKSQSASNKGHSRPSQNSSSNSKPSPNTHVASTTVPNFTTASNFGNNLGMSMTSLATSGGGKGSSMSSGGVGSTSELSSFGLSGSVTGLSSYGIGGSQTGLSSIGMSSGGGSSMGLSTLGLGLGGSSTGLSTIGLGSSGLSGSNLGLSNLGLASLAGFGQMGGSSTGLQSMGLTRTGSFGGSREHIMSGPGFTGMGIRNIPRSKDPFSRDVPGYPQRGDYPMKRDGGPPPPPPRDMSTAGTITAAQPATSYSAPATPSHGSGFSYGSSHDGLSDVNDGRSSGQKDSMGSNFSGSDSDGSDGEQIRSDLIIAADSVTTAMSSLVRELNSESSEEEDPTSGRRRYSLAAKRVSKGEELVWPVLASSKVSVLMVCCSELSFPGVASWGTVESDRDKAARRSDGRWGERSFSMEGVPVGSGRPVSLGPRDQVPNQGFVGDSVGTGGRGRLRTGSVSHEVSAQNGTGR